MEQATPVRPTSGFHRITSAFNGRLLFSCGLLALSQMNFGMDLKAFAATQAMPFFVQKFGTRNPTTGIYVFEPYFLSLLNSLNYIGFAFGLVSGSYISRRFGRRLSIFIMCIWAIAAAAIIVTAEHREQVLAGRIIAYVYVGMELAVIPVLQSELVPKHVRGFVVGSYQSGILVCRNARNQTVDELRLVQPVACRPSSLANTPKNRLAVLSWQWSAVAPVISKATILGASPLASSLSCQRSLPVVSGLPTRYG
jgi:hypothetical protein